MCADFTGPFPVPGEAPFDRRLVYFPGSTIGNFERHDAVRLLSHLRRIAQGGAMLIGIDMVKDPRVMVAAYDDAAGVTAAVNLNALEHLNRRLGTDFDPTGFRHRAVWNAVDSRIEMHLVSRQRQLVRIGDDFVSFAADEALVSEHSHKYTRQSFSNLAWAAGWQVEETWTDPRGWFGVLKLVPGRPGVSAISGVDRGSPAQRSPAIDTR